MNKLAKGAIALMASGAIGLSAAPAAHASNSETVFQFDGWEGTRIFRDGGAFERCAVVGHFGDVASLSVTLWAGDRITLGFMNDAWELTEGRLYPIAVTVDNLLPHPLVARAGDTFFVLVAFSEKGRLYSELERGELLYIELDGEEILLRLTGLRDALERLEQCREDGLRMAAAEAVEGSASGRPAAAAAAAGPSIFQYQGWYGEAQYDEEGQFWRCTAVTFYGDESMLGFSLGFIPLFTLHYQPAGDAVAPDQPLPVSYRVDEQPRHAGTLRAAPDLGTDIFVADAERFIGELEKGDTLHIRWGDEDVRLSLTGIAEAVDRLYGCWEHEMQRGVAQESMPADGEPATGWEGSENAALAKIGDLWNGTAEDRELIAPEFARMVLERQDDPEIEILPEVPAAFGEDIKLVWGYPDGIAYAGMWHEGLNPNILEALLVADAEQKCAAEPNSDLRLQPLRHAGASEPFTVITVTTECAQTRRGPPSHVVNAFYPLTESSAVYVMHASFASADSASERATFFFDAFVETFEVVR